MPWTWTRNTTGDVLYLPTVYGKWAAGSGGGWVRKVVALTGLFNGALNCANQAEINNVWIRNLKQICTEELERLPSERMRNPLGDLYRDSSPMFTYGKGQQNQPVSFLSSELDPFNIYTIIYFGVFFLLLPLLNIYGDILNGRYKSFAVSFVKRQRHVK